MSLPLRAAAAGMIVAAVAACASHAQSADETQTIATVVPDDGRRAAIQAMLDSPERRPAVVVPSGVACAGFLSSLPNNMAAFKKISAVHVAPHGPRCYVVTWDSSAKVAATTRMGPFGQVNVHTVPVGRYIVDKVGQEQTASTGAKITPYRAHFERSRLGDELAKAGMWNRRSSDIPDGQAILHKDADGTWIAGS